MDMDPDHLLQIVGSRFTEPRTAKVLAAFVGLRHEAGDSEGTVRYLRSDREGILVKLSGEGEVLAIFFMSEGKDGFAQYCGELPGNLDFDAAPDDAVAAFGKPALSQPAATYGGIRVGELLRFDADTYSLHVQFRATGGIDMVSVVTGRAVPGRSVARKQPP